MATGIERNKLIMVGVLLAGTFVAVLNATLLTPALPSIMADMNVSQTTVQWLTSGYALTEAVIIPLAAYAMGQLSTRKLFIGGMACFGLGSVISACAPSFGFLLAGRILQAACTGLVMPMVMSTILLVFPREKRGSAMGVIGLLIGFAPAIGPSLSGLLIDSIGWRAIFVIVAAIAFVVVVAACFVLKNNSDFAPSKFDALSVVLSTVGLLSLLYGLSTFSSSSNYFVTAALVVLGLVVCGIYVKRQLSLSEPMLRVGILRTFEYRTVTILVMIFQAALIGMETIMPLYIQGVQGHSATVSGVTLLPGAIIGAFVGLFAGRLFDRHGVRLPVCVGACIITLAALGFTQLRADTPIVLVSAIYATMSVGMQFTMTPLNTWGVNSLPNDDIRHAQSTSNTLNQVAGSFGIAALVSISSAVSNAATSLEGTARTFAGYHVSFCTTAGLALVAVAIILLFVKNRAGAGASAGAGAGVSAGAGAGVSAGAGAGEGVAQQAATPGAGLGSSAAVVGSEAAVGQKAASASAGPFAEEPLFVAPQTFAQATVADAMNRTPATVSEEATMGEVVALMAQTETTGVSVVSATGALVGYVTDGDVARYLARNDRSFTSYTGRYFTLIDDGDFKQRFDELARMNVMKLATKHVMTCTPSTPLDVACALLSEKRIKKVPVVEDGKPVGALSRRNVMHYLFRQSSGLEG